MSSTRQQIADELLTARDESRSARAAACAAAEGVVSAIIRRHRAEDAFDEAKASMLAAHRGEADARNALERGIERAVAAGLCVEALSEEAADPARDRAA